jgi:undecaprenyl-diphosphatase
MLAFGGRSMQSFGTRLRSAFTRTLGWARQIELVTLLSVLLVGLGVWTFVELADEVFEGETRALDERLLLAMRNPQEPADPIGPEWLEEMARDVTALGGVAVLATITLASAGFLALGGQRRVAIYVVAAVAGGLVVSTAMKSSFSRPRPDLVPHGSHVTSASFPSGHSMMATTTYLTLGALLARVNSNRRIKIYLMVLAISLSLAVGVSRVYLGVHWPTDVLAGWVLGASWATLCWLVEWRLQRTGTLERSPAPSASA